MVSCWAQIPPGLTSRLATHGDDTGGLSAHLPRVEGPHPDSHFHRSGHGRKKGDSLALQRVGFVDQQALKG